MLPAIDIATQTVGIYPSTAKTLLRSELAQAGAQRIVTLGHATEGMVGLPQDGVELLRRMVKWVVDESVEPATHG